MNRLYLLALSLTTLLHAQFELGDEPSFYQKPKPLLSADVQKLVPVLQSYKTRAKVYRTAWKAKQLRAKEYHTEPGWQYEQAYNLAEVKQASPVITSQPSLAINTLQGATNALLDLEATQEVARTIAHAAKDTSKPITSKEIKREIEASSQNVNNRIARNIGNWFSGPEETHLFLMNQSNPISLIQEELARTNQVIEKTKESLRLEELYLKTRIQWLQVVPHWWRTTLPFFEEYKELNELKQRQAAINNILLPQIKKMETHLELYNKNIAPSLTPSAASFRKTLAAFQENQGKRITVLSKLNNFKGRLEMLMIQMNLQDKPLSDLIKYHYTLPNWQTSILAKNLVTDPNFFNSYVKSRELTRMSEAKISRQSDPGLRELLIKNEVNKAKSTYNQFATTIKELLKLEENRYQKNPPTAIQAQEWEEKKSVWNNLLKMANENLTAISQEAITIAHTET